MSTSREPIGQLVLLGAGGHAAVVADAAVAAGWTLVGCFDDKPTAELPQCTLLGAIEEAASWLRTNQDDCRVHAAVGDGELRAHWAGSVQRPLATIVHPRAIVAATAQIDDGVFIGAGAVVNPRAHIGEGTIVNTCSVVEHDCTIGPYAHIAPGAVLGGGVTVGRHTLVGLRAAVLPGCVIGNRAVVGAGATVLSDVPDNTIAVGTPARARPCT